MEGVILSSWDYIMGPQIERLWFINYNPKLCSYEVPVSILRDFNSCKHSMQNDFKSEVDCHYDQCDLKIYSFMCGQLLLGEMDATEVVEENISRTYISDYKILISVVFRLKSWVFAGTIKEVKNVSLCVGLIFKRDAVNFILKNQFTLDCHLRRLAGILQKTKPPYESVFSDLSDNVLHIISLMDSLYHSNLSHIQNNTFSSIQDYSTSSILTKAIASHLQTSGHTAILGGSEFKIKQIVNVLSLFNNQEELCCSLLVNQWPLKSKISAFYIRGIIKNSDKDCEYLLEYAHDESLSLTVIDTDLCKVWQTYPFHANIEKNRAFSSVTEAGYYIPQLLNDLSFGNKNNADCHTIIQSFRKMLTMKAVSLVKTVTHFSVLSEIGKNVIVTCWSYSKEFEVALQGVTNKEIKRILSKQELMVLLAIYSLVDLQIILGCAEKIRPGIRCFVL